ncbi:MAG: archaellin/type IV pilin N-terminal domain-containing protein [Nitrososphaerales archaeon]
MTLDWCTKGEPFNGSKKGISPVVATVILVAVAVVIAAALAGFSSSLFGTYSDAPNIAIKDMVIDANGDGRVTVTNTGASADSVISVQVPPNPPATNQGATSPNIEANSEGTITYAALGTFSPG